jgi:hypothetical protein
VYTAGYDIFSLYKQDKIHNVHWQLNAVLRPTQHFKRTQSEDEMLLFFSNKSASHGTNVELEGWNEDAQTDRHWVVIQ